MAWVIAGLKINRMRLSIRRKLLLISAVLLVVPWIGVLYIQDMENFLRSSQEENLLGRAQIVAAVLEGRNDIFKVAETGIDGSVNSPVNHQVNQQIEANTANAGIENTKTDTVAPQQADIISAHLYVRPLRRAIQLDGYLDDWLDYTDREQLFESKKPLSLSYKQNIGSYGKYLYMVFEITDDRIVYRQANNPSLHESDHLKIIIKDKIGHLKKYIITTSSPGWVNAFRMEEREDELVAVAPELRIKGEWQETAKGYNIEIRLPLALIGDNLSFFIADIDNAETAEINQLTGSTPSPDQLASIIIPTADIEALLNRVIRPASRTWLIDRQFRVLAVAGNLKQSIAKQITDEEQQEESLISSITRIFYQFVLKQPSHRFKDDLSSISYFQGQVIESALQGRPAANWRVTPDKQVHILTATYPVMNQGKAIGVIAIEETSNAILILQNRAMEILINLSVITFLITIVVLLSYATRLSIRIRHLRDEAEQAITSEGRITHSLKQSNAGDEIGDLSRSFSDMLARLGEYNRYLETMAGKLSHELRTPITVVRSSLENLQSAEDEASRNTYILRAQEGMQRLSDILTRMSEATRLEQTLQAETKEVVNLCELLENCTAAYRLAYTHVEFDLNIKNVENGNVMAAPELLAQMLDKLISNAVDFHKPETPIRLEIYEEEMSINLSVINYGAALPEQMQDNLFESMVSVRSKRGNEPHLGLGLYIVRMIVEFHQGSVRAKNTTANNGVKIEIRLPKYSIE